jgi:carboxyl-terminal processing protease
MRRSHRVLLLLAAFAGAAAAQAAPDSAPQPLRPRTTYEDMQEFSQVLNQIRVNHPDTLSTHELLMAAVEGMVRAADPHSFVMRYTPMSAEKEKQYRDGKLFPVPLSFQYIDDAPIVIGVVPGSSASRVDILPGDELIAADGKPVAAEGELELDLLLAGPKNSPIKLSFERRRVDGSRVTLEREVKREKIDEGASAVPTAFMLDPKTGYVRVTTFMGDKVADDLHDALGHLESQGMERLVLDLRDNGGGRIDQAARIAGEFLPSGTIVFTSEGRKKQVSDTGRVKRSFWKSERRDPIVLMVDQGTASASELVAGALQDHDRALIVGRPTFGKALLMGGFPLMDGSMIELVIGHVKTPCGRVIQREYHQMTRHAYWRMAGGERDTVGRPWCKTDGGRVVYGGGGIYPDILFVDRTQPPIWYARIREDDLPLKWLGGYVSANPTLFPSLDALAAQRRVPDAAVAQFREFVEKDGIAVPPGEKADTLLQKLLTRGVARVKWGDAGYFRIAALLDADVALAVGAFDRAQAILGPAH